MSDGYNAYIFIGDELKLHRGYYASSMHVSCKQQVCQDRQPRCEQTAERFSNAHISSAHRVMNMNKVK